MSPPIPKSVFSDVVTIRTFILHDYLQKVPIFEGFKNLSEVIGKENIDFPEYEFWYYRFLSGNVVLEDDRSSASQPLTLLDLPMDSLLEVISHLDLKNRLNVRKVSKSLRDATDSCKVDHSYISIDIGETSIRFKLDDSVFNYSESPLPAFLPDWEPPHAEKIEILNKDFQTMALKDLENVLKSTKNVQFFEVASDRISSRTAFESFVKVMENKKFDVKGTYIKKEQSEEVLKILSFFKPGKLEDICLDVFDRNANLNLLGMEQFKKARKVDLHEYGILDFSLIDPFYGFEKFAVRLEDIQKEYVDIVQNVLEKLPGDRDWTFYSDNLFRIDVEQAIDHSRVVEHGDNGYQIFYETKIPNSEYFINFHFVEWECLSMRKHK